MRERGGDGVLEVVDAIAFRLAAIAIVDPGVPILVHEQWHANSREITVTFVAIAIAPQGVPGSWRNRVSGRADSKHVENRVFTVSVPTRAENLTQVSNRVTAAAGDR